MCLRYKPCYHLYIIFFLENIKDFFICGYFFLEFLKKNI